MKTHVDARDMRRMTYVLTAFPALETMTAEEGPGAQRMRTTHARGVLERITTTSLTMIEGLDTNPDGGVEEDRMNVLGLRAPVNDFRTMRFAPQAGGARVPASLRKMIFSSIALEHFLLPRALARGVLPDP